MIKIQKYNHKWRIVIENETLEFDNKEDFYKELINLIKLKEEREPYKYEE
jgi:hypothetical protein